MPSAAVRGAAAIALADLGAIEAPDLVRRLEHAEPGAERPSLSVALARLGHASAVGGLVDSLKVSFTKQDWAEHDLYAGELTRLGTTEAKALRAKWYRRI